jgi:hypothetical protein
MPVDSVRSPITLNKGAGMANYPQTTDTEFSGDIVLTNGGSAGIGTTSPSERLDVSGKIKANNGTSAALNLPVLTSDPASPAVGDVWIVAISGSYYLKARVAAGTTKRVQLT